MSTQRDGFMPDCQRPDGKVDVSIVVPCRNEVRYIRMFLENLLHQDYGGLSWEAIIADGMSDDGTRELLKDFSHPQIFWIDNPEGIVSTGLNRAIRRARGEYVLRMDLHADYAPDYVRRSVETLVETGADNAGGPARTRAEGYIASAIAAAYHSAFACGGARFHDERYEGYVDTVTYGCWRRSTLERLGLFDEGLVRNQDDELNLRIIRAGGRIWQSPRIVSWYVPRSSLWALARQYFQYGFWKVAVIRKHRIPASWRHLVPGMFVLGALGLPAGALFCWGAGLPSAAAGISATWGGLMGLYLAASIAAAVWTARRRGFGIVMVLPVVFACYHFSYGLGFLSGLVHLRLRPRGEAARKLYTGLTR